MILILLLLLVSTSLCVQGAAADLIGECTTQAELCYVFGGDPNLCYGLYFELCVENGYVQCFREYNECLRTTLGAINECAALAPSYFNVGCIAGLI